VQKLYKKNKKYYKNVLEYIKRSGSVSGSQKSA
jgi:Diacylglycerol kinase accessory domain